MRPSDVSRYHRQSLLPFIGEAGQRVLSDRHAMIVGCGALGCASADILARAGVGVITIIDRDVVELTNLQRQCLFDERDAKLALPKATAAANRLGAVNSGVRLTPVVMDFTARNARTIFAGDGQTRRPDVILDGTDNFQTRYLLNDLGVETGTPLVYGGAVGTTGAQATFNLGRDAPCLRCVFENPPAPGIAPTCDTAGVLASATQVVGALQAGDALKVMLGRRDLLSNLLTSFDLLTGRFTQVELATAKNEECPCCGRGERPFLSGEAGGETTVLCGSDSVQLTPGAGGTDARPPDAVALARIGERMATAGVTTVNEFLVRGRLRSEAADAPGQTIELLVFADGRAIIRGTRSVERARALYARYVGT